MTGQYETEQPSRDEVDKMPGPVVLDFGTNWCGYCQAAQPLIAQAFHGYPGVRHIKVEDGKGRPLGRSFAVKLWPSLIFLRDGMEIDRLVRPTDAESISRSLDRIADKPA